MKTVVSFSLYSYVTVDSTGGHLEDTNKADFSSSTLTLLYENAEFIPKYSPVLITLKRYFFMAGKSLQTSFSIMSHTAKENRRTIT